jgi:hypothetical protein
MKWLLVIFALAFQVQTHAQTGQCQIVQSINPTPLVLCSDNAYEINGSVVLTNPRFSANGQNFALYWSLEAVTNDLCKYLGFKDAVDTKFDEVKDENSVFISPRGQFIVEMANETTQRRWVRRVSVLQCNN